METRFSGEVWKGWSYAAPVTLFVSDFSGGGDAVSGMLLGFVELCGFLFSLMKSFNLSLSFVQKIPLWSVGFYRNLIIAMPWSHENSMAPL